MCKRKKEADGREDEECLKVKLEGKKKKESCKGSKKEEDCLKVVRNGDGCVKEVSEGVASNAAVVCKKLAGEEEEDNDDGGSTLAGSKTASCETGSGDETRGKVTGVEEAPLLRPSYQPSFSTPPPPYSNALSSNNICNNNNNISNNNSISNNISISNNGNSNTPEAQRPFIEEGDESPHSPHQAGLLSSSCYVPREENSQYSLLFFVVVTVVVFFVVTVVVVFVVVTVVVVFVVVFFVVTVVVVFVVVTVVNYYFCFIIFLIIIFNVSIINTTLFFFPHHPPFFLQTSSFKEQAKHNGSG